MPNRAWEPLRIKKQDPLEMVAAALKEFAERGVFRGFSADPRRRATGTKAKFKMLWHRDRNFELIADSKEGTLQFPMVLPAVPVRSAMYKDFKDWAAARQDSALPGHRRIDAKKCMLACTNKKGDAGVILTCLDGDWEYATRKLITLVHETYLVFLNDGRYYEYMLDVFDLDPDHM